MNKLPIVTNGRSSDDVHKIDFLARQKVEGRPGASYYITGLCDKDDNTLADILAVKYQDPYKIEMTIYRGDHTGTIIFEEDEIASVTTRDSFFDEEGNPVKHEFTDVLTEKMAELAGRVGLEYRAHIKGKVFSRGFPGMVVENQ